jgi:hypothetical protein
LRKRFVTLLLFASLLLAIAPPVYAQDPFGPFNEDNLIDWRELETENFIIVYADSVQGPTGIGCACGVEEAQVYANFIDEVYGDLVDIFGIDLATPINLRLFPTEESYYEVNPIAEQLTGVVAHAMNSREEIAIALPRTRPLTDEDIINNLRHELTHLFASLLSDGNLTAGFQEGIAQYVEKPNERSRTDPSLLQQAYDQGRLLTWDQLDSSANVFSDPQVAYPQALAITAFLVDAYGFAKFIDFIEANAVEPGYRSALQTTYGQSATELEAEWLRYLPDYFAGRWQVNAIYEYDLSRVVNLVENGAFADAETELTEITELLRTTEQTETLDRAEQLLSQARQGKAAGLLADEAREAFQAVDYSRAIAKSNEALAAYQSLDYRVRQAELQVYIQRAELGQQALDQLAAAEQKIGLLSFFAADQELYEATAMLQALGHQEGQARGLALLERSSQRQSLAGYGLLGLGGLVVAYNLGRRVWVYRRPAQPLEMEYTA